jgi:hypothetical protein
MITSSVTRVVGGVPLGDEIVGATPASALTSTYLLDKFPPVD